jgi:hypothetical protein
MKTKLRNLLIEPKCDTSVSKVVQQLPGWIEALQGSKATQQPLGRLVPGFVNRHPPMGNEEEYYL